MGSTDVVLAFERIKDAVEKMEWRTKVEVAKVLLDVATTKQAGTTAAVEVARATRCLVLTGQTTFDSDGNLSEEWNNNATRTKIRMKENTEERRRRKLSFSY